MKRIIYLTFAILILLGSVSVFAMDSYYPEHEERPHIPSPYNQADVAAGVGLATAGIVILNAVTNTSVFGSASFNGSFNPQASPSVQPGAGTSASAASGSSGASAGMASTAQGASTAAASQASVSASGGGGIIKAIGDFFKGLFDILRDMLTDEGRSYASGKMTDILSNTDISDFTDNE